jgi:arylsulfate sulfotransferase
MKTFGNRICLIALLALGSTQAHAAVKVEVLKPSHASPQKIGTAIVWTVRATDSNTGPLTFQFRVAPPGRRSFALVKDFNVGVKKAGSWNPVTNFEWTPTGIEGDYKIQVVAKDFTSGETDTRTAKFSVKPLVTGSTPVVVATGNPLVALFSAPACPRGSTIRVSFQPESKSVPAAFTNSTACNPNATTTFEIAGMYPSTAYQMIAQVDTGGSTVNSTPVSFTTGALPSKLTFPTFTTITPPGPGADTADAVILHGSVQLGGNFHYPDVAIDLEGKIIWYYAVASGSDLLTRPLQGGGFLSIQSGAAWNPATKQSQLLRQFDLAGNIVRETNTGIIQQELLAMGETNAAPCDSITKPAPVGSACMGSFHHEAMQALPNGQTAVIADIERIFPVGTQGDNSGLPVDIIGDVIIVLDTNWQVVWYFDTFAHDMGAPQLDLTRPAVLGETCTNGGTGCPAVLLLGSGVAPRAHDWLHANSVYYWPAPQNGTSKGDLIWSSRHQDWIMRVNYQDGGGNGDIMWRLGPCGDFTFNNTNGDPWPWNSHQHEVAMESNGAMSLFDNGNTRDSPTSGSHSSTGCLLGLGSACGTLGCSSRGMALTVDETHMQVTPVLSQYLGYFSTAMGSAQLLDNGNYFFQPAFVIKSVRHVYSYAMEIQPTTGTVNGTTELNIESSEAYRAWQMLSMYAPPIS